jgi:GNAT superfamily N-acetyltransferase
LSAHIEQIPVELAWQIRHQAMYPDKELEAVKLQDDADGIHFGLFDHEQLISVVSWFRRSEKEAQFRKLGTLEEFRNGGYGTLLMQHLIDFSKEKKIDVLWCNARVRALGLYKRFGFNVTNIEFEKKGIEYIIIQLKLH